MSQQPVTYTKAPATVGPLEHKGDGFYARPGGLWAHLCEDSEQVTMQDLVKIRTEYVTHQLTCPRCGAQRHL